jgi:cell division initiation protein
MMMMRRDQASAMRRDKIIEEVLGDEALLTPSDLYNTEFKNALVGGYDKDEVDDYLERAADTMEALINRVRELKEELEAQRHKMEEVRDMENTLKNALISSQKFGENIEESARRQAEALLAEARAEREQMLASARQLPEELAREITALKAERDRLRTDLRAVLAAHSALLLEIPTAEAVTRTLQEEAEDFRDEYHEEPPRFSGEED